MYYLNYTLKLLYYFSFYTISKYFKFWKDAHDFSYDADCNLIVFLTHVI